MSKTLNIGGTLEYIDRYKRIHVAIDEESKKKIEELKLSNEELDHVPFYKKEDDQDKTYVKINIPVYKHDNLEKYELLIGDVVKTKVKIVRYNNGSVYGSGLVFRILRIT